MYVLSFEGDSSTPDERAWMREIRNWQIDDPIEVDDNLVLNCALTIAKLLLNERLIGI